MKKIYLPKLKQLTINNFSFYQQCPTFSFTFKDGISAIVGANGIGKTTFINAIIYALVGYKKEYKGRKNLKVTYQNSDYFSNRIDKSISSKFNELASVSLNFSLNKNNITITRSLVNNKIIELIINTELINEPTFEKYESIICSFSGIPEFEDLELIIREFLVFDESRKNVAWSVDNQTKLLRILLFDNDFYKNYESLKSEITELDSKARHKSEDLRMAREAFESLKLEKEKISNEPNKENNIEDTLIDKTKVINNIDTANQSIIINLDKLEKLIKNKDVLFSQKEKIKFNLESINENLDELENKLYSQFYDKLPDYYYDIENSLIKDGKCLLCGTKSNNLKQQHQLRIKEKKCLICNSVLTVNDTNDSSTLINKINELNNIRDILINNIDNYDVQIKKLSSQIESITLENNNLNSEINTFNQIFDVINYNLTKHMSENNVDKDNDTYHQILFARQEKIDNLLYEKNNFLDKKEKKTKEFNAYISNYRNELNKINKSLSYFFNKYAETFIGWNCKLYVSKKVTNKLENYYYLPEFDNSIREDINAVSESQRFFLDQAFRMSIINYMQNNIEDFSTFFITETPEGSLDIVYEKQVANMFIKFADTNNNIIFTSNLNSSKFLYTLFDSIKYNDFKDRVLNLLTKSKLSNIQLDGIDILNEIYDKYLLEE